MPADRQLLEQHYARTHYVLRLGGQQVVFHIGRHDPAHDRILRERCGVQQRWCLITPFNPGSVETDEDVNLLALLRLRRELDAAGLRHFDTVNQSPEGEWLELGFMIADADAATSRSLARRYRQNAFVEGMLGEAPRLVWMI